jgi:3-hydroxybutyryl-CoA dehydrogenase
VRAVADYLGESVRRRKLTARERDAAVARVEPRSIAELGRASIVIEAVPEDLDLKARVFGQLEDVCDERVLFHTNTSTLPVTTIAGRLRRPANLVGTHYCNPAPLMRLVEVAPARQTSAEALDRTTDFLRTLGKVPVVLKDTPGLLTNFLLVPFENDCIRALEAGWGTVAELDLAVTEGAGFPMGVFRLLDIVGLDVHRAVSLSLYEQLRNPRFAPPPLVDRMIAAGELGRKTGAGFYRYEPDEVMA